MRLYVDSNVFISLIREEVNSTRSLFSEAVIFFEKVRSKTDIIIISSLVLSEIKNKCYTEKEDLIEQLIHKNIKFEFSKTPNKIESTKFEKMGVHKPDSIHLGIAIQEKCDAIITFNAKDFNPAKNIINVILPNEY